MPRWKELPDELDPQVREFAEHLRRLVERSGLGVTEVADRTGYSRSSWERYLDGRLLPPRSAVVALADVTRNRPEHLTAMWEMAERAWTRTAGFPHGVTPPTADPDPDADTEQGGSGPPPARRGIRAYLGFRRRPAPEPGVAPTPDPAPEPGPASRRVPGGESGPATDREPTGGSAPEPEPSAGRGSGPRAGRESNGGPRIRAEADDTRQLGIVSRSAADRESAAPSAPESRREAADGVESESSAGPRSGPRAERAAEGRPRLRKDVEPEPDATRQLGIAKPAAAGGSSAGSAPEPRREAGDGADAESPGARRPGPRFGRERGGRPGARDESEPKSGEREPGGWPRSREDAAGSGAGAAAERGPGGWPRVRGEGTSRTASGPAAEREPGGRPPARGEAAARFGTGSAAEREAEGRPRPREESEPGSVSGPAAEHEPGGWPRRREGDGPRPAARREAGDGAASATESVSAPEPGAVPGTEPSAGRRAAGRPKAAARTAAAPASVARAGDAERRWPTSRVLLATLVVLLLGSSTAGVVYVAHGLLNDPGTSAVEGPSPSPGGTSPSATLPAGVRCLGDDCAGKNPEEMGCGGKHADTAASRYLGTTLVELRYSETCRTAWARIIDTDPGSVIAAVDEPAGGRSARAQSKADDSREGYTAMLAVRDARALASVRACAELPDGTEGCTKGGQP